MKLYFLYNMIILNCNDHKILTDIYCLLNINYNPYIPEIDALSLLVNNEI